MVELQYWSIIIRVISLFSQLDLKMYQPSYLILGIWGQDNFRILLSKQCKHHSSVHFLSGLSVSLVLGDSSRKKVWQKWKALCVGHWEGRWVPFHFLCSSVWAQTLSSVMNFWSGQNALMSTVPNWHWCEEKESSLQIQVMCLHEKLCSFLYHVSDFRAC